MAALLFDDITDGLKLVNCPYQPPDTAALKGMLGGKSCSKMYSKIVVWLCDQMKGHVEPVTMPQSPDEEPLFRYIFCVLTRISHIFVEIMSSDKSRSTSRVLKFYSCMS